MVGEGEAAGSIAVALASSDMSSPTKVVEAVDFHACEPAGDAAVDATELLNLSEPTLLELLRRRHAASSPYTAASSALLVAVRPTSTLPELYSQATLARYARGEGAWRFSAPDFRFRLIFPTSTSARLSPRPHNTSSLLVSMRQPNA